ncbi:MAG: WYL domain-containing protein [Desulfovibrio sp.]|nr:WYL domain-containing protein [Desulfovibrio sp.]
MPVKLDQDATTGTKLLRLFQRLMLDGRRHYQGDLAEWLNCSRQTVIRLTTEIERVIGASLETGIDRHRRWYRMVPRSGFRMGPDLEEVRYLRVCRDMAAPYLPEEVAHRVDESILRLSLAMNDATATEKAALQKPRFAFFSKGRIDYTPFFGHIDTLLRAQESRRICVVRYRAAGRKLYKTHRFAVGRMLAMNNALYALGADVCEDFRSLRHLCSMAVHRICEVKVTEHPVLFSIPEADPGTFGLPWHEPRTFRIRFTPGKVADYVRERTWADAQRLEETPDGGLILTITTRSQPELAAWVRSFGDAAELLSEEEENGHL